MNTIFGHFHPFLHSWRWSARRRKTELKGFYFLRNFKSKHEDRVQRAIQRANLEDVIVICRNACDETGPLPDKIAVYCKTDFKTAEGFFFQYYSSVKTEIKRERALRPVTARRVEAKDFAF